MKLKFHKTTPTKALKEPSEYLCKINKKTTIKLSVLLVAYILLGICINTKWEFPHFIEYVICFTFIGVIAFQSTVKFSKEMHIITSTLISQPSAKNTNTTYFRYCKKSNCYIVAPTVIILVFGIGGCSMFGSISLSPTFIWVMSYFIPVVYISIIGYLQYIVLAIYIYNLSNSKSNFKSFKIELIGCIPSKTEWLIKLTKLSHYYRSRFFTLGTAFILSFAAFCWLPNMQATIYSFAFYLLWGVIFVVVVLLFPIVSFLEYKWIKKIVSKLKSDYIKELAFFNKHSTKSIPLFSEDNFLQMICITQIINSTEYPIKSNGATLYATCLSLLNLVATVLTIAQGFETISIEFLQIF